MERSSSFPRTRLPTAPPTRQKRNKRAVAAYHKSGFEIVSTLSREEQLKEFGISEYEDSLLMIRVIS